MTYLAVWVVLLLGVRVDEAVDLAGQQRDPAAHLRRETFSS